MLASKNNGKQKFQQACNLYYWTIQNAKWLSWQNFLKGKKDDF